MTHNTPTVEEAARQALDFLNNATTDDFQCGRDHNIRWALSQALGVSEDEGGTVDHWDDDELDDATSELVR